MKIADLSHYQGTINWDKARKELDMIIFRASVGSNYDNKYMSYTADCNVPFGTYHYLKAGSAAEARTEAQFYYERAMQAAIKPLFFVADIEYKAQTKNNTYDISLAFVETLRSLGAKKVGLYIPQSLYPYAAKEAYDFIWIPRYGKDTGYADTNYQPIYECDLWQYTSKGKVDGIDTNVDLNQLHSNKTLEWFIGGTSMAEEFINTHFAEWCRKMVGQKYWYGTCVYACTQSLLNTKSKQYPAHYTSDRTSKYKEAIAAHNICSDCVGLIKGYAWTNGGQGVIESIGKATPLFKNQYGSNGMPDKSANGMFEYAKSKGMDWGTINTIPDIPGIAVRYDGHVGVYVGNGEVVEARGFNYGIVLTKLKNRNWLHWYKIPTIKYNGSFTPVVPSTVTLGERSLRKSDKGNDVKDLQGKLNEILKLDLVTDGDFGSKTEEAVKKFQSKYELTVDGIYGAKSHAKLMSIIADRAPDVAPAQPEPQPVIVHGLYTNGEVNVRVGDSTAYEILTNLAADTPLDPMLDINGQPLMSSTGWYAIRCNAQIGWVSNKYIEQR